jgi:hypothetical protein
MARRRESRESAAKQERESPLALSVPLMPKLSESLLLGDRGVNIRSRAVELEGRGAVVSPKAAATCYLNLSSWTTSNSKLSFVDAAVLLPPRDQTVEIARHHYLPRFDAGPRVQVRCDPQMPLDPLDEDARIASLFVVSNRLPVGFDAGLEGARHSRSIRTRSPSRSAPRRLPSTPKLARSRDGIGQA